MSGMDLEKKHSTIIAILEMIEGLTTAVKNSLSSTAVFTYLKKIKRHLTTAFCYRN